MGSGVIFYEYEKCEKFEDYDEKADAELGTIKIRRYHFDDESFVHPLHSVRFDLDRPYEIPIEPLLADHLHSSSISPSPAVASSSLRRRVAGKTLRLPKSWELIPPSKGWMCERDDEDKEIGGIKPSIEKEEASDKEEDEEDSEEEEEDPEEEVPGSPLPMDVDADEDYLQYLV
ncbi:hypothetical protein PIB30_096386 [Stylosanthes scabra]|uniref:Uncharacterized protein n=1 Tax=Stylosanthes scabra TaxID=79078 RepID=A0ABU6TVN7_9FABA|nr:hypothetical protein [Stylosanthes scabra]